MGIYLFQIPDLFVYFTLFSRNGWRYKEIQLSEGDLLNLSLEIQSHRHKTSMYPCPVHSWILFRSFMSCQQTRWLHIQRKFRNLTSDYTESCRWRSVNQEMWSRRCDTAEMCEMRFWRVGIAQNAVFFHIVLWLRRLGKSVPKNGSCGGPAAQEVDKICTTLWRESVLEVKIVKNWQVRSTFGSWAPQNLHHAVARERFGSQNR